MLLSSNDLEPEDIRAIEKCIPHINNAVRQAIHEANKNIRERKFTTYAYPQHIRPLKLSDYTAIFHYESHRTQCVIKRVVYREVNEIEEWIAYEPRNPFVVPFYSVFCTDGIAGERLLWLVMENLPQALTTHSCGGNEQRLKEITLQSLRCLDYLHAQGIAHLDIKPSNFMFDVQGQLRLIDFGYARWIEDVTTIKKKQYGTYPYKAPEVFNSEFSRTCDVWSLGVMVFFLYRGGTLFYKQGEKDTAGYKRFIKSGIYGIDNPFLYETSCEFRDFIERCLTVDPVERATVKELLEHPFVKRIA